jgi:hypothetical protein
VKPAEVRRLIRAQEQAREARGEALETFLRTGEPRDVVRPELIPDAAAHREAVREVRRLVRLANRAPRGARRSGLLLLIFVERVLELEPLERAGLTPARLVVLSRTSVADVTALAKRMGLREGGE